MMTQNIKKPKNLSKILGPESSRLITGLLKKNLIVFSFDEAVKILESPKNRLRKLIYDLIRKGWIRQIEKGRYFLIPLNVDSSQPYTPEPFLIASKLINPYYLGFWTMLNYYGYPAQLVNTIFIATTKRKKNFSFSGVSYKFIKISPNKMFGLTQIEINGSKVLVSDKEKTLIDCLDHPEYCGGISEIAKGLWNAKEEIDFQKLLEYAKLSKNSAIIKRLGFLLEHMKLDKKLHLNQMVKMIRKGYSSLDPLMPKKGKYYPRWNLLINIPPEQLLLIKKR